MGLYQYRDVRFLAAPRPVHHVHCRIICDGNRDQMDGRANEAIRADRTVMELALGAQVVVVSDAGLYMRREEHFRRFDRIERASYLYDVRTDADPVLIPDGGVDEEAAFLDDVIPTDDDRSINSSSSGGGCCGDTSATDHRDLRQYDCRSIYSNVIAFYRNVGAYHNLQHKVTAQQPLLLLSLKIMIHFTCCLVYFVVLHASVTAFLPGRMIPMIPAVASQRSIRSLIASRSAKPDGDNNNNAKGKFSLSNLVQLITMGAGAPMLGEYKETDENGRMIFELEANNYVDSDGKIIQTKAKYFTDGYVEDDFEVKPPGFFANLLSGGKLQAQWDEQFRSKGKD